MFGTPARDARRTEIYLDGVMAAEERGAMDAPVDMDVDPAVLFASRRLRADLIRPHPSFRFEEALARRLTQAAGSSGSLRTLTQPAWLAPDGTVPAGPSYLGPEHGNLSLSRPRISALTSKSARPLIVGGVASAISIGAVYVAWRWSRAPHTPMARAVRATRTGRGHSSGRGRRVLNGIFGVMS
jgi:hypothetical protein